jgi:hypothetical protein
MFKEPLPPGHRLLRIGCARHTTDEVMAGFGFGEPYPSAQPIEEPGSFPLE